MCCRLNIFLKNIVLNVLKNIVLNVFQSNYVFLFGCPSYLLICQVVRVTLDQSLHG